MTPVTPATSAAEPSLTQFEDLEISNTDRARVVLRAAARTAGYLSPRGAARRHRQLAEAGVAEPPSAREIAGHVALDEVAMAVFQLAKSAPSAVRWSTIAAEVEQASERWEREGWLDDPASYHGAPPPPIADHRHRRVRVGRRTVEGLSFLSGWAPHPGEPGRDRWLGYRPNHVARVYVLRHSGPPRPWIVCVHGAQMGRPTIDTRVFGVEHLYRDLGLNVALPVLPLHGRRRPPPEMDAMFPTVDLLDNVHGLAQGAWDVRRVLAWVRAQGAPGVAVLGVSLGGNVTALVAGLEPALDCVIAGVPVSDFPSLFRRSTPPRYRGRPEFALMGEPAQRLHRVVSPLALWPATPRSRRFLFAGAADRLIDPVGQVLPLSRHWGSPVTHWFPGGHVGHLRRADIAGFVDDALRACDLA